MHHCVPKAPHELFEISHTGPNPSLPGPRHIAFPDHGHGGRQVCGSVTEIFHSSGDVSRKKAVSADAACSLACSIVGSCDVLFSFFFPSEILYSALQVNFFHGS
jgi:hypothetical protein